MCGYRHVRVLSRPQLGKGLDSATQSQVVVIGGILTIAIADAFSDALGMHMSEESTNERTTKQIWESTGATFISKLVFALTFLVPIFLLPLQLAVIASIIWGIVCLTALSIWIAQEDKEKPLQTVLEHLSIAVVVIITTHFVGDFVGKYFGG